MDVVEKIKKLDDAKRKEIEDDIQAVYAKQPGNDNNDIKSKFDFSIYNNYSYLFIYFSLIMILKLLQCFYCWYDIIAPLFLDILIYFVLWCGTFLNKKLDYF